MRKSREKAQEVLSMADERANVILARFGASDSTAAAALFTNNTKVFQEAITALDTEDAVFNQEMLAKQLQAQNEFDAKALEIENKYQEDTEKVTEAKSKLAMDFFKQFLSFKEKRDGQRFKLGELILREQINQAREDQKNALVYSFKLFDEYGSASLPQVQGALAPYGIDLSNLTGLKTFKELKTLYDVNKPYYDPRSGSGGGSAGNYAKSISEGIQNGSIPIDRAMSDYFGEFGSARLVAFGQDLGEAIFDADASWFVDRYEEEGLIIRKEGESMKKPLMTLMEEGLISISPSSGFVEAIQDELGAANTKYAFATDADISNWIHNALSVNDGVLGGLKISPQYYEAFDKRNGEEVEADDMAEMMQSMGGAGMRYVQDTFETADPEIDLWQKTKDFSTKALEDTVDNMLPDPFGFFPDDWNVPFVGTEDNPVTFGDIRPPSASENLKKGWGVLKEGMGDLMEYTEKFKSHTTRKTTQ